MSYPIAPPPVAAPAPAGRPPVVSIAAVLLWVMAAVGLIYAIATLAVVPGTLSRFRTATGGAVQRFQDADPESYIAVVWLGAAIALAVAVILVALYTVLGIALRRGSNTARLTTLVVCALGALAGLGAALTVAAQRSGGGIPGSVGDQLSAAYPGGWLGANVALAILQVLAYVLVGALVLAAPKAFFEGPGALPPGSSLRNLQRYGGGYPPVMAPGSYGPGYGPPPAGAYGAGPAQPLAAPQGPWPGPAPAYGPPPAVSPYGPPPAVSPYGPPPAAAPSGQPMSPSPAPAAAPAADEPSPWSRSAAESTFTPQVVAPPQPATEAAHPAAPEPDPGSTSEAALAAEAGSVGGGAEDDGERPAERRAETRTDDV